MAHALLVSLRSEEQSRTFSVDEASQSMVWLGLDEVVSVENAIAVVLANEEGLILRPARGYQLLVNRNLKVPEQKLSVTGDSILFVMGPQSSTPTHIHVRPVTQGMREYGKVLFTQDVVFLIGRAESSGIRYPSRFVSSQHAVMEYRQGHFSIKDLDSGNGTLVNGTFLPAGHPHDLSIADVIQILDLTIMVGKGFLTCNHPEGIRIQNVPGATEITHEDLVGRFPKPDDGGGDLALFYPAPRLSRTVADYELQVDDPPPKKEEDDAPFIMQLGPSMFMGISSIFMAASAISRLANGGDVISALPQVAMSISMLGGSLIWPIISKRYSRRRDRRLEERRSRRYVEYLDGIENQLVDEASLQSEILRENRLPAEQIIERAHELSPFMMNRMSAHDDFMELRVGMGDVDLAAEIRWPQKRFSLSEDNLLNKVKEMSDNPPKLDNVPVAFSLFEHRYAGIVGPRSMAWAFLRGLLIQICGYYSYQDVKIALVADRAERAEWDFLCSLQHFYDDAGTHRFVALSPDGMIEENLFFGAECMRRSSERVDSVGDLGTYYVIVCANKVLADRFEALNTIAGLHDNLGFSILYLSDGLHELPRECTYIIDLKRESERYFSTQQGSSIHTGGKQRSAFMFEQSDFSGTRIDFDPDIMVSKEQARAFALDIARARLDLAADRSMMPESVGFLEMLRVGNVSHLNIAQRWADNDASRTLQTPLGIDELGEHATLNLHEKIHGPHGLIAGTTGSGKSEFIITYILSMCVNYAPDEVAFVLIDYKGGGLAGTFENERYHLPHLAGTITNLDGGAIQRSLVSIQSENRRRQDMFNKARDITGESTMDIYKYLSYYRQGILTEPLPHLMIVADEFAELKQQEPEFMDELISTARIGRSLGVHLILATQRPTGVVNDQIWANATFKICLKVNDAGDSKEMIRRPDAAEIKNAGRYYLMVGYNESFSSGQAAYAGAPYIERQQYEPKTDNAVDLIDDEGEIITTLRPVSAANKSGTTEVNAVLEQLMSTADSLGKHAKRLWLDPLPAHISLARLQEKYGKVQGSGFSFALGEVDDPMRQRQFRREVDLAETGNVMFYGTHNSGVGQLVGTYLFDMATRYNTDEYWFYGIDLGAGAIAALAPLPQCGGVALTGEDEKIGNLLKLVLNEIEERKRLVAKHKSVEGYNRYAKQKGEESMPRIVLAIDNLASFRERYDALLERLVSIAMDGPMCGVHMLATSVGANTAGMKLKQHFSMDVVCAMSDPSDATYILVNARNAPTPNNSGRGLINIDKEVFEFQGPSIADDEASEEAFIKQTALKVRKQCARQVREIPVLPERVLVENMGPKATSHMVPVGYSKRDVEPVFFDVRKFPYMLVLGEDNEVIGAYLDGLREWFGARGVSYRFIDTDSVLTGADGDPWVLREMSDVESYVLGLPPNPVQSDYLVLTSAAKTMGALSEQAGAILSSFIVDERTKGKTVVIAASELMRVKGVFDPWFTFLKNPGSGLWVGNGFGNQSVLQYGRTLPEYNRPAARADGFMVARNVVTSLRLLEREAQEVAREE